MTDRPEGIVRVIDSASGGPELPVVEGRGGAWSVVGPDTGARFRSFRRIDLLDGGATVSLRHAADSVYYVIAGAGTIIDVASGVEYPLGEGTMVHIDAGDGYRFRAAPGGELKLLGGPCPAGSD